MHQTRQYSISRAGIRWTIRIQAEPRKKSEEKSEAIRSQTLNPGTQSSQATLERQP